MRSTVEYVEYRRVPWSTAEFRGVRGVCRVIDSHGVREVPQSTWNAAEYVEYRGVTWSMWSTQSTWNLRSALE